MRRAVRYHLSSSRWAVVGEEGELRQLMRETGESGVRELARSVGVGIPEQGEQLVRGALYPNGAEGFVELALADGARTIEVDRGKSTAHALLEALGVGRRRCASGGGGRRGGGRSWA